MTPPPPLQPSDPPCSVCRKTTVYADGRLHCYDCGASWQADSWADSSWDRPDPRPCPSAHRRYPKDAEHTCVLPAGHLKRHRGPDSNVWWD